MKHLQVLVLVLSAMLSLASPAGAQTDAYPSRVVRFVVPIGPGSSGDVITRALADRFRALTGQPAIVENRAGGDLVIATQHMLNSPADGYTVLMVTSSIMILNPMYIKGLPYKVEDVRPVAQLTRHMAVLVTSTASKFNTLSELIAAAGSKPGAVGIGTYGNYYRLGAITLARRAGVEFGLVPYKGAAQVVADVVNGSVDVALVDPAAATALITAGKLRALAVTGTNRYQSLPGVPTVAESGFPGYDLYTFLGFAVHAQTPEPVARRLEQLILQVAEQPEFRDFIARQGGAELVGSGAREFSAVIDAETKRYRELAKSVGDVIF